MKNLFNDISQEEKSRILEMHSGKKNVISEQVKGDRHSILYDLQKRFPNFKMDAKGQFYGGVPSLILGDDTNGAAVQMPDIYTITWNVSKNNKTILDKKMKLSNVGGGGDVIFNTIVSDFNKLGIK